MRRGRFCPKCGSHTEEFHDGLCRDCFSSNMDTRQEVKEKITIYKCKMCGKFFSGNREFEDEEGAAHDFLRHELGEEGLSGATFRLAGDLLLLTLRIESDGMEKEIKKTLNVVRKLIVCKYCSLMKSNYFNITIQLRAPKTILDQMLKESREMLHELNSTDKYAFISGEKVLKEGIDLMIGSKGAAEKIAKEMKRRYGAEIKISRKLYGLVDGKKTYRDTILVSVGSR